jgi:hypothetical protein
MAKLGGIIKLEGTLDNLTFYKSKDGYLVKTKGGISRDKIMNDPAFVRTRENGTEFGHAANAGKLLRVAVRNMVMNASDSLVTSRLTQTMAQIKNYDSVSARGERQVSIGLEDDAAKQILKGFNFNEKALLSSVLYAPFTVDRASGVIDIANLTPTNDISYASGATHVSLQSAFLDIDFLTGETAIEYSPKVNLAIDGSLTSATLTPSGVPAGTGNRIYLMMIEFFQEVNGVQYSLKNGAYNVLGIVGVDYI